MKRIITTLIMAFLLVFLSSCIFFQIINQPSISLPNEVITVSINANTEGGDSEPYFGVCLPVGWTIPGDSIQCFGVYTEVIYYDSLVSFAQDSVSPAPNGYYWWAGSGVGVSTESGNIYADLSIQTDSQVGLFSIDYMLGNSYYGVNQQRSDGHLIQITEDPVITSVVPDKSYQNFTMDINIQGFITHFSDGLGTQNVWLSQSSNEIYANSFVVNSNTSLVANFSVPLAAPLGLWDVNVETDIDGIITKSDGFEIFPPIPVISVTPDSFYLEVLPGTLRTRTLMISNNGWNELSFDITPSEYALEFDGVDGSVNCGNDSSLNPTTSITVEAWVFLSADHPDALSTMIRKENNFLIELGDAGNNRPAFNLWTNMGPIRIDGQEIEKYEWHHLAGTYDGNVMKLFVDGIENSNLIFQGNINFDSDSNLYFGNNHGEWFNGKLDEVRIWNVARTQQEIQQFMNQELEGSEQGLVGYWPFNEGIGDTAFDKTTNGNNGLLIGDVEWVISTEPTPITWLSVSPDSGICYPGSSMEIVISFDATELDTGNYYAALAINSNDPFNSQLIIPVHMLVSTTAGIENEFAMPTAFKLFQNYPNPFNPNTTFRYSIPTQSKIIIKVYDILGIEIETLVNEEKAVGTYEITWYAGNLPTGVYFYQLKSGGFIETKKMLLLK